MSKIIVDCTTGQQREVPLTAEEEAQAQAAADEAVARQQAEEAAAAQAAETSFVLAQAVPTLRLWASQADAHTVTSDNAVATVRKITDNLAIFYDRFADLLEMQYGAQ